MSEQRKKGQRIYDLLNAKNKVSLSTVFKEKKHFLPKKSFLRKWGSGGLNKNRKEGFLTNLATAIKKDPRTLINWKSTRKPWGQPLKKYWFA